MTCPNCGTITEENENKCPNCGYESQQENVDYNQNVDYSQNMDYTNFNTVQENYYSSEDEDIDYETDETEESNNDFAPEQLNLNNIEEPQNDYDMVSNIKIIDPEVTNEENNNPMFNSNEEIKETINKDEINELKIENITNEPKIEEQTVELSNPIEETNKLEELNKVEETNSLDTNNIGLTPQLDLNDEELDNKELSRQLNDPKESNKGTLIIIVIVILLIIGALVYIGFLMKPEDSKKANDQTTTTTTTTTVTANVPTENDEVIKIVDKYYKLPGSYKIDDQKNNTYFVLNDGTRKIAFSLFENDGKRSYEIWKNDLTKFQNEIKTIYGNEVVVSIPTTEQINGIEIIYSTISNGDNKALFFACNTMYQSYITGITSTKNNIIDKKGLEDFVQIFYNETQNTTKTNDTPTAYEKELKKYDIKY